MTMLITLTLKTSVSAINLASNKKFMMVGTPEEQMLKEPDPSELPDVCCQSKITVTIIR